MKKIIIIGVVAISVSSCNVYKTYNRPDVTTDNLYGESLNTTDTASIASLSWRELFTDSHLQTLVEEGLENNTDLQIAYLRITQAQATLQSSKLAYLPSVSFNSEGALNSFDRQKASKSYQLAVSSNWELDVFGKLTSAKRGAKAALEQSEAYRQAVQTNLVSTIANSYYTLLMLDRQLEITEHTLDSWQETIRTLHALKKAGSSDDASVAQAEANKLSVEASMLSLRQQITETENGLSSLLGKTPQQVVRGKLDDQQFPQEMSVGVPLQLLSKRPDVRNAEMSLAQAFYSTNEARAAFYPSITLSGTAGWTNSGGGIIANPGALLLEAVGSLTQPIFNRGTNKARLKIAEAQQEEAKLEFKQSILDAGAEVNNALTQWQTSRGKIEIDIQQIASLERAVKSTQLKMKYGNTTYLEVLTAETSLLDAELTLVNDRFDEIQGVINLYHALGGGY
ncbi:TolC family protein [Parabacteroides sp. Marseille-P3160]|uniref:TolC family protein n=1 Tax=Parabacteroides sp. Marseille-P3160 TaxID=1917887 RepID=UPI0009BC5F37|nr:TolC family protein [Parabacteroides sp. Marseille-P3160]